MPPVVEKDQALEHICYDSPATFLQAILLFSTVKPSKPRCYTESSTQEGKDIVLKCKSSEGSSPLKYSWEKTSDSKLLPASSVMGERAFPRSADQT